MWLGGPRWGPLRGGGHGAGSTVLLLSPDSNRGRFLFKIPTTALLVYFLFSMSEIQVSLIFSQSNLEICNFILILRRTPQPP